MASVASTISVFIVAENFLLREALTRILNRKNDIEVVGSAAFSALVIEEIASHAPHVLLLDLLPEASHDLSVVRALVKHFPSLNIIMIDMDPAKELFLRSVRTGVAGYLLKDATAADVAAAVRSVARNEAVCPPELCRVLFEYLAQTRGALPSLSMKQETGLTRREQQLIEMISRGLTNKEIATALNLSEQTIKNHVHRILHKLGAQDRLVAVEVCRTQGFLHS
ncbi:MAG TPA: response regulator transcription factor [Terriglobales bacterium]|nr:response regulator transcription factor [Terriglobales bacterium]